MNKTLLAIAGVVALGAFASAQEAPFGPAQGVKTISLSGSYTNTDFGSASTRTTSLSLGGSYFFTNAIAGVLSFNYSKIDANVDSTSDGFRLGGRYFFNANRELTMEQPLHPFVGLFFSSDKVTGQSRTNGLGIELGAHYFLQPNVAITPTLEFARSRISGEDTDTFQFAFGLTVFFK
jgi:hypothetical protein